MKLSIPTLSIGFVAAIAILGDTACAQNNIPPHSITTGDELEKDSIVSIDQDEHRLLKQGKGTSAPTRAPTKFPTRAPTTFPTRAPTSACLIIDPEERLLKGGKGYPTRAPTRPPTKFPTRAPTNPPKERDCNDNKACTVDSCDPATGCVNSPVNVIDPPNIDGIISPNEWTGAATATIGNGGGTAYFKADANFIYGAFDITGWTSQEGATSNGNLLGFGVWNEDNSYPGNGVEFQQATGQANWGNDGQSGTLNGLVSAFRINAQSPPASSIPTTLEAMDSFGTGHRVWEVKMPISTMTVVDCQVWVVGGINYAGAQHWYPASFFPGYNGYFSVQLQVPVP